jgi:hypothetical protein
MRCPFCDELTSSEDDLLRHFQLHREELRRARSTQEQADRPSHASNEQSRSRYGDSGRSRVATEPSAAGRPSRFRLLRLLLVAAAFVTASAVAIAVVVSWEGDEANTTDIAQAGNPSTSGAVSATTVPPVKAPATPAPPAVTTTATPPTEPVATLPSDNPLAQIRGPDPLGWARQQLDFVDNPDEPDFPLVKIGDEVTEYSAFQEPECITDDCIWYFDFLSDLTNDLVVLDYFSDGHYVVDEVFNLAPIPNSLYVPPVCWSQDWGSVVTLRWHATGAVAVAWSVEGWDESMMQGADGDPGWADLDLSFVELHPGVIQPDVLVGDRYLC